MRSKLKSLREQDAELFFLVVYGATSFPWIRRQDCRFVVNPRSLKEYTGLVQGESDKAFQRLSIVGWIYNYRKDVTGMRFSGRLPEWLTISETAKLTEKYIAKSRAYGEDTSDAPARPPKEIWMGEYNKNPFKGIAEAKRKAWEELHALMIETEAEKLPTPEEIIG